MPQKLQTLQTNLGYKFKKLAFLELALSHRSFGAQSNERLEFLGDAILNFTIAAKLYELYPDSEEGVLSRLRSNLVNGKTLAILARKLNIGEYLLLGSGEKKSGGAKRDSILADAMEAVFGAIYLDGGIKAVRARILHLYQGLFKGDHTEAKDPKTKLQEFVQSKKLPLPHYEIIKTEGAAHSQTFYVKCEVVGLDYSAIGIGLSRRQAEQDAAEKFLERMQ